MWGGGWIKQCVPSLRAIKSKHLPQVLDGWRCRHHLMLWWWPEWDLHYPNTMVFGYSIVSLTSDVMWSVIQNHTAGFLTLIWTCLMSVPARTPAENTYQVLKSQCNCLWLHVDTWRSKNLQNASIQKTNHKDIFIQLFDCSLEELALFFIPLATVDVKYQLIYI